MQLLQNKKIPDSMAHNVRLCLTLMVRHTINAGLFEKPHTKHHQCARSASPSPPMQAHRPAGAGDLWRGGPSTRGPTGPQRAQQGKLVVRSARLYAALESGGGMNFFIVIRVRFGKRIIGILQCGQISSRFPRNRLSMLLSSFGNLARPCFLPA